jgi:hypothetical protein
LNSHYHLTRNKEKRELCMEFDPNQIYILEINFNQTNLVWLC